MDKLLEAAREYHKAGWAVLWLRARSKQPHGAGWNIGPRADWGHLAATYRSDFNLGVRLGTPSMVGGKYLACLDVDVKDSKYLKDATNAVLVALSGSGVKKGMLPEVVSGKGNGSGHLYFLTEKPFKQVTFGKVKDCWEVCAYSDGRQMVLPPSVHPETGARYHWKKGMPKPSDLPTLALAAAPTREQSNPPQKNVVENFQVVEGAELLALELSPKMRELLESPTGDRSAALVPVTRALLSAGATKSEILTVLTHPSFGLAQCAYDHVGSGDRKKAAEWLSRYTVNRLVGEQDGRQYFKPVTGSSPEEKAALAVDGWRKGLHVSRDGRLKSSAHNLVLILQNEVAADLFRRDEFSKRIYYGVDAPWGDVRGNAVTDTSVSLIQLWFSRTLDIDVGSQNVWSAIIAIAEINSFHPVRSWLESLEWDGTPRLDSWLRNYLGAEMPEPYLTEVSRKVLVAAVARVFKPGVKFDHMLILEGKQGAGKSTAVADLAGQQWFLDHLPDIRDKDALVALQGKWFVEISELATLKRANSESYKAFFSTSVDNFRAPYGRTSEEFPRQCIFVGTTNQEDYLSDLSGNRRFWPVKIGRYRWRSLKKDRAQLFAEACVVWETFDRELHLSGEAHQQALEVQGSRVAESDEAAMADQFAAFWQAQKGVPKEDRFDFSRFKLHDLSIVGPQWVGIGVRNFSMQLAARILKQRGFEKYPSNGSHYWRSREDLLT